MKTGLEKHVMCLCVTLPTLVSMVECVVSIHLTPLSTSAPVQWDTLVPAVSTRCPEGKNVSNLGVFYQVVSVMVII